MQAFSIGVRLAKRDHDFIAATLLRQRLSEVLIELWNFEGVIKVSAQSLIDVILAIFCQLLPMRSLRFKDHVGF